MSEEDILDSLINVPILSDLSGEDLKKVAPYWHFLELPSKEILFEEGDPADALYYVLSGKLVIYKNHEEAIPVELARVSEKQFFGEQAVLEDSVRSGTLQAIVDTRLLVSTKDGFYEILEKHPRVGVVLLKGLARYLSLQLRRTTGQFVALQNGCA